MIPTAAPHERQAMIARIRSLPAELSAACDGLSAAGLDTPYREGGWTPRQILHHLADSHMNAFIRMKLILAEDHPTVKTYEQDDWARMPDYSAPIEPSLAIISGLQERMATVFEGISDEAGWQRAAHHPEHGEVTMGMLLAIYSDHGRDHVRHITAVKEKKLASGL